MIVVLFVGLTLAAVLLTFSTLVQMLYMDTLRLRTRELPMLEVFREKLEDRIGLKAENGVLAFSLIKHSILAILGALVFYASSLNEIVSLAGMAEAAAVSWVLMFATAYLIPQLLYRRTGGGWLVTMAPLLKALVIATRPITAVLTFLQSLSQLGEKEESLQETNTAEENIDALITAGAEEGIIEEEDRKLIQSVVAFGNKTVREVMTPRPSMVSIAAEAALEDLRQVVIHERFSRVPVFEDSIDNVIGFVHVRDMFELDFSERAVRKVREVVRPIQIVPETKPVNDLLREMQAGGAHMSVVVDEYGNTAGLVTMEDMVEEILGEIGTSMSRDVTLRRTAKAASSFPAASMWITFRTYEFRRTLDMESTTVGGLVTEWMGRVPQAGESVERDNIRMEVLSANELRVDQVRISKVVAEHDA
ncbi:MAG: CBS domain-containing protein [Bryobacteraceae bacterium]